MGFIRLKRTFLEVFPGLVVGERVDAAVGVARHVRGDGRDRVEGSAVRRTFDAVAAFAAGVAPVQDQLVGPERRDGDVERRAGAVNDTGDVRWCGLPGGVERADAIKVALGTVCGMVSTSTRCCSQRFAIPSALRRWQTPPAFPRRATRPIRHGPPTTARRPLEFEWPRVRIVR